MFNRHSGVNKPFMPNKPYMGVSPAHMAGPMGVSPAAVGPMPYAPTAVSPATMGPAPYAPTAVSPAAMGPMPYAPTAVSPAAVGPSNVLPTTVAPPQVSPTQQLVNKNVMNTVVPHIHPSHTTTVNQQVFTHKHYFPHTQSVVNQCCSQHLVCPGPGPMVSPIAMHPCCPPRPPFHC